jgi:formylglycine-generating enzyme required for sulfatase activity
MTGAGSNHEEVEMGTIGLAVTLLSVASFLAAPDGFDGTRAGEEKTIAGLKLCWCPPGRFTMGSPRGEPERRPGEDQVEVTLTRGFWAGKYEVTQGDWKRFEGKLPGPVTAQLPEGDDYPVGNVNIAEAEAFCRSLTELARKPGCWRRAPTRSTARASGPWSPRRGPAS